jgi:CRP-like cAMP-binding protein
MQIDDAATILAGADFFDICSEEERRLLAFASERKRYPAGAVIVSRGEVPAGAQVLVSGTVAIANGEDGKGRPRLVSQPGTIIATMALVVARPREVTVTAEGLVETLLGPRHAFMKLANQSPEFARRAAERIRQDLVGFVSAVTPVKERFGKE